MPNICMTLHEVSQSVSRPVIFDIIAQVKNITGIKKDVKVFFPGDTNKMHQAGTTIDGNSRDPYLGSDRIIFIEVEEPFNQNSIATTAVSRNEHPTVFSDPALNVYITPIYSGTDVTINFKYRTTSKTEAERWVNDVRIRVSAMRDLNVHGVTYHYPLPRPYLHLLDVIHQLRSKTDSYGDIFEEYITRHASSRLTVLGDQGGKNQCLAISEKQTGIIGMFGFDAVPEKPERDDGTGAYTVSFSYKFTYEKPIACTMVYPIMVHNSLLPPEYAIMEPTNGDSIKANTGYSLSLGALNHFTSMHEMDSRVNTKSVIRIPKHDEFYDPQAPSGTVSIMTVLCEIDTETRTQLFNLKELGDVVIDEDILDFIMKSEYPYITQYYKSIVQLNLYRNDYLQGNKTLRCTPSGDLISTNPMSLRDMNRVRLSLVADIVMLDQAAVNRLKKFPKAFVKIVGAVNEGFRNNPLSKTLGQRRYITDIDFREAFRKTTGLNYNTLNTEYNNPTSGKQPRVGTTYSDSFGQSTPGYNHVLDPLKGIRGQALDEFAASSMANTNLLDGAVGIVKYRNS